MGTKLAEAAALETTLRTGLRTLGRPHLLNRHKRTQFLTQVAHDTTERIADSFAAETSAHHRVARSLVVTVRKHLVMQIQTGWEAELQACFKTLKSSCGAGRRVFADTCSQSAEVPCLWHWRSRRAHQRGHRGDVLFAVTHLLPAILDAWAAWLRSVERGSVRFRSLVGECELALLATLEVCGWLLSVEREDLLLACEPFPFLCAIFGPLAEVQGKPIIAQQTLVVITMMLLCSRKLAVPLGPRIVGQLAQLALRMDAPDAAHTVPLSPPAVQSTVILTNVLQALARQIPEVALSYLEVLRASPSEPLPQLLKRPGAWNVVPAKLKQLVARAALPLPELPMRASQAARTLEGAMLRLPVVGCCSRACTSCELSSELELPLKLCSGCRVARYCSPECQAAAWAGRKRVCRVLGTEGRGKA